MNWKRQTLPVFLVTALIVTVAFANFTSQIFPAAKASLPFLNAVTEYDVSAYPVKIYIVFLDDVGSMVDLNLTEVARGVLEAAKVSETAAFIDADLSDWYYARIKFKTDVAIVKDWNTYRDLIENGGNIAVVNIHNEILPVPNGYAKEAWVAKISDFLANRWGTWIHCGGYPFYHVQYENGVQEEWGQDGFAQFMSLIGKVEIECCPPQPLQETENYTCPKTVRLGQQIEGLGWNEIAGFPRAMMGRPLKYDDFKEYIALSLYEATYIQDNKKYCPCMSVRYMENGSFSFGYYVHMGVLRFTDDSDYVLSSSAFGLGYISTAAEVYCEVSAPITMLTYRSDGVNYYIMVAEKEGRTEGLEKARQSQQKGIEAYTNGQFKQAIAYAYEAIEAANNATKPSTATVIIVAAVGVIAVATIASLAAYKIHKSNNRKQDFARIASK